jgi:hypothetical protein
VFPVRYGLYLCVPYGSHNKQLLFPQAELTVTRKQWLHEIDLICFNNNCINLMMNHPRHFGARAVRS